MVIKFELIGMDKVISYAVKLPQKQTRALTKTNINFMNKVLRSAKARAPRNTGYLAESLILEATKTKGHTAQVKLVTQATYALFQEEGFSPHPIPIEYFYQKAPGQRISKTKGFVVVRKFTPFIQPALEFNIGVLSQDLDTNMKEELSR